MTLLNVSVDDPIEAVLMNNLINNVNGSPYRQVFTANGTWQVPAGCHKFKVYLCGAGGHSGPPVQQGTGDDLYYVPGGSGGQSTMASALFAGVEVGTTIVITIGAPVFEAAGSASSFGATFSSAGGAAGSGLSAGAPGTATFPPGAPAVYHGNSMFTNSAGSAYGAGGVGTTIASGAGNAGICVIEW